MAEALPDRSGLTPIAPGSDVWKKSAEEMSAVVKEYEHYLRLIAMKSVAEKEEFKLSTAKLQQLEKLRKTIIELRTANGTFAKGIEELVNKLQSSGGLTSAVTRLTGAIPKLGSEVDSTTGFMNILGNSTQITAAKFNVYVLAVQALTAAFVKLIEKQDQARAAQGRLIKEFGSAQGLSISTPYTARATGYTIAGTAGKEAAENLMQTVFGMRGINNSLGPGTPGYDRLVTLTAGANTKVPEYLSRMRGTFAMQPNMQTTATLENAMTTEFKSRVPLGQLTDSIFELGQEFVKVGMTVDESTNLLSKFADAVGKAGLPMQAVMDIARQAKSELTTGAGVTGMFTMAHFATRNFKNLLPETQEQLNAASQKVGGKNFLQLGLGEKASAFEAMGSDNFATARLDIAYKTVKGVAAGTGSMQPHMMKVIAEDLAKLPWLEIKQVYEKMQSLPPEQRTAAAFQSLAKSGAPQMVLTEASRDFQEHYNAVAALQKGFFDDLNASIQKFYGSVQEFGVIVTGRGSVSATAAARNTVNMNSLTAAGDILAGKTPEQQAAIIQSLPGGLNILGMFSDMAAEKKTNRDRMHWDAGSFLPSFSNNPDTVSSIDIPYDTGGKRGTIHLNVTAIVEAVGDSRTNATGTNNAAR